MTNQPIYFDNAATTKIAPAVQSAVNNAEQVFFYNSSALYSGSRETANQIEAAKDIILTKLGVKPNAGELYFMSGATEANNTVIFGKIKKPQHHLVVICGEHSSVHSPAVYLEQNGFAVDYAPLKTTGEIDIEATVNLIKAETALLVFGLVNSDVGTLQNAGELVKCIRLKNPKTHIHCDAVQAFCKFNFSAADLDLDSVTISAHKIHGPKGIGALWIKRNIHLPQMLYGGEHGLRPGTQNNAGIIGFAKAAEIFNTELNYEKVSKLHTRLIKSLPTGCKVNGINNNPYITNILLPNIYGETVLNALNSKNIFVGLGSACAVNSAVNRTLRAMGFTPKQQKQVLRISFCADSTTAEADTFLHELNVIIAAYK